MKADKQTTHMIDFLFTIALFGVFAASALLAVIIGANVYKSTTENMSANYSSRTSMAYVTEKIRQHDEGDAIEIANIDGFHCLAFHETYDDSAYTTYIYAHEGQLKELFIRDALGFSPDMGEAIIDIQSFEITAVNALQTADDTASTDAGTAPPRQQLFLLSITDAAGQSTQMYVSARSEAASSEAAGSEAADNVAADNVAAGTGTAASTRVSSRTGFGAATASRPLEKGGMGL